MFNNMLCKIKVVFLIRAITNLKNYKIKKLKKKSIKEKIRTSNRDLLPETDKEIHDTETRSRFASCSVQCDSQSILKRCNDRLTAAPRHGAIGSQERRRKGSAVSDRGNADATRRNATRAKRR